MWLIDRAPFKAVPRTDVERARQAISKALAPNENTLTLVIGNSPSRIAAGLHPRAAANLKVGWEQAVDAAAEAAGFDEGTRKAANQIALAQAVIKVKGKAFLLQELEDEFLRAIGSTVVHDLL